MKPPLSSRLGAFWPIWLDGWLCGRLAGWLAGCLCAMKKGLVFKSFYGASFTFVGKLSNV